MTRDKRHGITNDGGLTITATFLSLQTRLKAVATRLLRNADDADDAVQEAFCRLWSRRQYINEGSATAAALTMTTVRNVCIDMLRRSSAHPTESFDTSAPTLALPPPDEPPSQEHIEQLYTSISQALNPLHQEMLIHRDRDNWSIEELAEAYSLSEANVRTILSRARKAVRENFRQHKSL